MLDVMDYHGASSLVRVVPEPSFSTRSPFVSLFRQCSFIGFALPEGDALRVGVFGCMQTREE